MLFKDLKENMLLPVEEFIINKSVKIRNKDCMVIGMTSQNMENKLWVILHEEYSYHRDRLLEDDCDNYEELVYERVSQTNKEKMQEDLLVSTTHLNIKSLEIQGQKITFTSSTGTSLANCSYDIGMVLQHFVEKGLDIDSFDEFNTNELILYNYVQQEDEKFPIVDLSKPLDIKICISEDFKQNIINKPITVSFGDNINEKYSFYNEEDKKNYAFYANSIKHHDIWEDANKHFDSDKMKKAIKDANISDEQLQEMKNNYYDIIEQTCPKGMYLAMIEYETENDDQLSFFTKEFLEAKVEHKEGKCGFILFTPDNKVGPHGLKNRICMLKPVEKDFNESLEIELFSWYKKIPEEVISLEN